MAGEKSPDGTWQEKLIAEARLHQKEREKGYRAQALKIHPPICARCGREFGGKKLRDLTVHHKDHNHENNPADGSNWELLCVYCHENEHSRNAVADAYESPSLSTPAKEEAPSGFRPFAGLEKLLRKK
jgi:5-methylcytosine-specific restriction endonuclease McrA